MKTDDYGEENFNPRLRKLILEVVDNQLRESNPPEVNKTLERLISSGISKKKAKRLIAGAVVIELFHIEKYKEPFNLKRYVQNLEGLPKEPKD